MQIHDYIPFARRWVPIALVLAVICGGGAYALSKYVLKPVYTATNTMEVNSGVTSATYVVDPQFSAILAETDAAVAEQGPIVGAAMRGAATASDPAIQSLQHRLNPLQRQLLSLGSRLKSLQGRLRTVTGSQKPRLQVKITSLQAQISALNPPVTTLQQQILPAQSKIIAHQSPSASCQTNGVTALFTCSVTANSAPFAAVAANQVAKAFIAQATNATNQRYKTVLNRLQQNATSLRQTIKTLEKELLTAPAKQIGPLQQTIANDGTLLQANGNTQTGILQNEASQANLVNVVTWASPPTGPSSPHPTLNALVAAFLVFLLALGFGLAKYRLNDAITGDEELKQLTGLPILGSVPYVPTLRGRPRTPNSLVVSHAPRSSVAEALRVIRTSISLSSFDHPARVLLVTSSVQAEGKSTVAANLATAFAESGVSTILVDLDLRRPSVAKIFNTRAQGLTNLLVGGAGKVGEAATSETVGVSTDIPNLKILPTGPLPPMPAELLASQTMRSFIDRLRSSADLVIIDSPPLLAVTDATVAATFCDAAIIVVRADKAKRRMMTRSVELLSSTGTRIAGLVVNTLTPEAQRAYYSTYQYTHNYGYAYGADRESPNGNESEHGDAVIGSLERQAN